MVLIDGQDLHGKTITSCFFFLIIDQYCFCYPYYVCQKTYSSFNSFGMVEEFNILVTQAVC